VGVPWEEVDGDDACTVLVRLEQAGADLRRAITVRICCSASIRSREERSLTVYGDEGSLHYASQRPDAARPTAPDRWIISRTSLRSSEWVDERVPERILNALPQIADDLHRNWAALAREFVADVRDEPHADYPTFRQGWINQEIIEVARAGTGWTGIPRDSV